MTGEELLKMLEELRDYGMVGVLKNEVVCVRQEDCGDHTVPVDEVMQRIDAEFRPAEDSYPDYDVLVIGG